MCDPNDSHEMDEIAAEDGLPGRGASPIRGVNDFLNTFGRSDPNAPYLDWDDDEEDLDD